MSIATAPTFTIIEFRETRLVFKGLELARTFFDDTHVSIFREGLEAAGSKVDFIWFEPTENASNLVDVSNSNLIECVNKLVACGFEGFGDVDDTPEGQPIDISKFVKSWM